MHAYNGDRLSSDDTASSILGYCTTIGRPDLDAALNLPEDVEALNDLLLGPLLQEQHACTRKI